LPPFIYFSTSYPELGAVVCDSHSSWSVRTSISFAGLSLFRTRKSTCFTDCSRLTRHASKAWRQRTWEDRRQAADE
jgi:hypothetical protein